jgi:hypothetical protein
MAGVCNAWFMPSRAYQKLLYVTQDLFEVEDMIYSHFFLHGQLPSDLQQLSASFSYTDGYASDAVPYSWSLNSATTGVLSSVGPDREKSRDDQGKMIAYDPTNGTFSEGDMIRVITITTDMLHRQQ